MSDTPGMVVRTTASAVAGKSVVGGALIRVDSTDGR